jgi:hypothetical protein
MSWMCGTNVRSNTSIHTRTIIQGMYTPPSIKCRKFMQPVQHFLLLKVKTVITIENVALAA